MAHTRTDQFPQILKAQSTSIPPQAPHPTHFIRPQEWLVGSSSHPPPATAQPLPSPGQTWPAAAAPAPNQELSYVAGSAWDAMCPRCSFLFGMHLKKKLRQMHVFRQASRRMDGRE